MADIYVSSVIGNNNANSGATWTLAKATVAGALAIAADGDTIYVDSAHSFSTTSTINWDAPSAGIFVRIISVSRNGSTTTGHSGWLAGAAEVGTQFSTQFNVAVTRAQRLYIYGCDLGSTGSNTNDVRIATAQLLGAHVAVELESCTLRCSGTGSNSEIALGPSAGANTSPHQIKLTNCTFIIHNNASGNGFRLGYARTDICGGSIQYGGVNKPAVLFNGATQTYPNVNIYDMDLSGYEKSGGAIFSVATWYGRAVLMKCKYSATPSLVTGSWPNNTGELVLINSDSGDTHNVFEYRNRLGTITENGSIYADTGARFDGSGISWEIVTSSSCSENEPFVTPWIMRWADETTSLTASLEVVHDSATNLNSRTAWHSFEYLGNASFPLGSIASGRIATPFEGTGTDWTSSSETWTGTGGFGNPNKQTFSATFTPAERSVLRGRLHIGAASKTLYLDPGLRLTGHAANPAARWTPDGAFNAEPAGGGLLIHSGMNGGLNG